MKAVYIREHGGTEALEYGELPEPAAGPNDVTVKVKACGVNRLDVFTRAGVRGTRLELTEPHVLGGDVAGEVAEVGSEVTQVKRGERVVVNPRITCGECPYCVAGDEELCDKPAMLGSATNGGYAEFVKVPAINTVPLPAEMSYEEAASLPTVFMPCWQMLMRRAALKLWETVLVLSASSGVGTAAIQVAKNVIGARVLAITSTEEKARKAKELGGGRGHRVHARGYQGARNGDHGPPRRQRGSGPRRVRLLACGLGLSRVGRALRHLRRHHGVQGRASDGAAVPA